MLLRRCPRRAGRLRPTALTATTASTLRHPAVAIHPVEEIPLGLRRLAMHPHRPHAAGEGSPAVVAVVAVTPAVAVAVAAVHITSAKRDVDSTECRGPQ